MEIAFGSRLKHAWNAFLGNETFGFRYPLGPSSSYRPDRPIFSRGNERSIITSVYNRIALDAASIAGLAEYPMELSEDEYFLLGDNRDSSEDSRFPNIGNVKREQILGKAWFRMLPLLNLGFVS